MRALVSVPRQHGKTELVKHGFVYHMLRDPTRDHAYVSYEAGRGHEVGRAVQRLALGAGMQPEGPRDRWMLPQGGMLYSTGIGGPLTGRGISGLLVVDDPHKNREEANSSTLREKVYDWWTSVAISGVRPGGSAIVVHTRWHPDDLIGRLIAEELGYEYVNLPALCDDEANDWNGRKLGEPLWPEAWPLEFLLRRKADMGEYDWSALMMGRPRPVGTTVFGDVVFYDELPNSYRVGVGVDLAVTAKTSSDYCVAVVVAESDGVYYVLDVRRQQARITTFASHFRQLKAAYPGARWLWYASSTELGTADVLRDAAGFPIVGELATAEKLVRAQPVAAAWQAGKVRLPRGPVWVADFVSEVGSFTGAGDKHDDQVDALAAAFDVLARASGTARVRSVATRFTGGGAVSVPLSNGKSGFQW